MSTTVCEQLPDHPNPTPRRVPQIPPRDRTQRGTAVRVCSSSAVNRLRSGSRSMVGCACMPTQDGGASHDGFGVLVSTTFPLFQIASLPVTCPKPSWVHIKVHLKWEGGRARGPAVPGAPQHQGLREAAPGDLGRLRRPLRLRRLHRSGLLHRLHRDQRHDSEGWAPGCAGGGARAGELAPEPAEGIGRPGAVRSGPRSRATRGHGPARPRTRGDQVVVRTE